MLKIMSYNNVSLVNTSKNNENHSKQFAIGVLRLKIIGFQITSIYHFPNLVEISGFVFELSLKRTYTPYITAKWN